MKVTVSSAVRFYRVEMLTCYFTKRKADKPFGKICILTRLKFVGRFWLGRCFFFNMNPRKYLGYWRNIRKPAGHKIKNNLHTFCNGSSRQAFLKEHLAPIQILFTVYPAMMEPFFIEAVISSPRVCVLFFLFFLLRNSASISIAKIAASRLVFRHKALS